MHQNHIRGWRRGEQEQWLARVNEVAVGLYQVRLLLRWVTVCGQINHLGMDQNT